MSNRVARSIITLSVISALALTVQGCFEIAVGTAVVGSLSVTDRRTVGAQTEDKGIYLKGEKRIFALVGDNGHVNVTSFNRKVLLTGEVKDASMKAAVEREAAAIEGVQSVFNELEVTFISSFTSRSNDSFITGKIKAALVNSKEVYANSFKVVTEQGTVYLLGLVTQREGQIAAEIARNTSGVKKVVKLFEYITEEDLKKFADTMPKK